MVRSRPLPRLVAAVAVALAAAVLAFAAAPEAARSASSQEKTKATQAPPPKKDKIAKLAEPWPSVEKLAERRIEAEKRALFAGTDPVAFTLRADFRAINRDRDPESTKRFPGTLEVVGSDGQRHAIPVQIGTRGRARLNIRVCSDVPLKLEFPDKKQAAGTVFEGQDELKLVTHCQDSDQFEQYVLREYLVYRVFNLFTNRSYRARLAKGVYVDAKPGAKEPEPRQAMIIEDDGDVARRLEGRIAALQNRLFRMLDQDTLIRQMLLQYLIANTDISILKLHNMRLVQDVKGALHPISYDFDYSGLVDAHYALADKRLEIASVRERLYRGPCLPLETLAPFFEEFRAKKEQLLAIYDSMPELRGNYVRDAKKYIEDFYKVINTPNTAKRIFMDNCQKAAGM